MKRHLCFLFAVACTSILLSASNAARAADHRESPVLMDSANNGGKDLNDIYLFKSQLGAGRKKVNSTVLIMTVNPFAGVLSPTTLDDDTFYEFVIDNDGDSREDLVYRFRYIDIRALRTQLVIVTRLDKGTTLGRLGIGLFVAAGFTGSTLSTLDGGKTTTGLFDDPFFFDLNGFTKLTRGTGSFGGNDFFDESNISAIVLEVPSKSLLAPVVRRRRGPPPAPPGTIFVWGRTVTRGTFGLGLDGAQVDRTGLPAVATALIPPGARRNDFNAGQPIDDHDNFSADVKARADFIWGLLQPGVPHPDRDAIANLVLPDVSTFNTNSSAGFLNGRQLEDDVIDILLGVLTRGAVRSDGVDANDKTFPKKFPYLAAPHRFDDLVDPLDPSENP